MAEASATITNFLQERIDAGDFPSAVYLIAEKGDIVLQNALGLAVVEPERLEARANTIYDLASLTKVLVTALIAAQMCEKDELDIRHPVVKFLPEFGGAERSSITVKDLLCHDSGLAKWLPLYLLANAPDRVVDIIASQALEYAPRTEVVYSDLNFLLLQAVIERAAGQTVDQLAKERIFDPLALKDTMFNPPATLRPRIAASEHGNEFERQTCIEQGYDLLRTPHSSLRTELIWGAVHDGNAYFMGGVAGHAGLFGTAEHVFQIAQQFLPKYTTLLNPDTCGLFTTNFTPGMSGHRSFGFHLASVPETTAGSRMSPESFGHLGFTGTSLWIDPVNERVFVLLTNRTHNQGLPFVNINSVRRRFHDLAIDELDAK